MNFEPDLKLHKANMNSSNNFCAFGSSLSLLNGKSTQERNKHAIKANFEHLSTWALKGTFD